MALSRMENDLGHFVDGAWGLALFAFLLFLPRVLLRLKEPMGLRVIGIRRLFSGYAIAVLLALGCLAVSEPLGVRPWSQAIPVRSATDLMAVSLLWAYVLPALVAWVFVAYLVAPIAGWLVSISRANGLLLLLAVTPVALLLALGFGLGFYSQNRPLEFVVGSMLALCFSAAIGFAWGAGLSLRLSLRSASAT